MELSFTELNLQNQPNSFNYNDYETNQEKYWEQSQEKTKKKKVTFDDILNNMNIVVNKNGTLQFMSLIKEQEQYQPQYQPQYKPQYTTKKQEQIDPSVKHSYIYNKYFKNYNDMNLNIDEPEIKVPKTFEEYNKMLLEERIKVLEHQKKISEIKSKKLLFTTNSEAPINPKNIQVSRNNLRKMNFY